MAAYRCSNCNLNYAGRTNCEVCGGPLSYMSNAQITEDIEEEIASQKRVAPPLIPENEKVFRWRRDELLAVGVPLGYAQAFAREREFDLHRLIRVFEGAFEKHGRDKGLQLALDILL